MTCCTIRMKIGFAIAGIAAGVMAGVCFVFMYQNISTTIMSFASSCFAGLSLYMHLAYKNHSMEQWTLAKFRIIMYTNALLFLLSTAGMIACLVQAAVWHQGISEEALHGENLWMTAVWCFMTAKWTGASAYYAWSYSYAMMKPLAHSQPKI